MAFDLKWFPLFFRFLIQKKTKRISSHHRIFLYTSWVDTLEISEISLSELEISEITKRHFVFL